MTTTTAEGLPSLQPQKKMGFWETRLGTDNYRLLKKLVTNPLAILGFMLLLFFALVAIFAPVLAPPVNPSKPYAIPQDGFRDQPVPPGTEWRVKTTQPDVIPFWYTPVTGQTEWVHLFGTAAKQYDIYYGVVWGTQNAFIVGIIVTFSSLLIGLIVGSFAAYYGGPVDMFLMRTVDIFSAFPYLLAAIVMSNLLAGQPWARGTIWAPLIALVLFGWMGYARLIRGDILAVREREFVTASKVIGQSDFLILVRHILPNAIFPTIVVASLEIGAVVISFAALSFLGIGVEPGYADWGQLISFARNWITNLNDYWYVVIYPGVAIVLFVMGWNLVGDAVRDVFDPRISRSR